MAEQLLMKSSHFANYVPVPFNTCTAFLCELIEYVKSKTKVVIPYSHNGIVTDCQNFSYLNPRYFRNAPRIASYMGCVCKQWSVQGKA
jgi:hypothetical protein